jgi:hypothetical protein
MACSVRHGQIRKDLSTWPIMAESGRTRLVGQKSDSLSDPAIILLLLILEYYYYYSPFQY